MITDTSDTTYNFYGTDSVGDGFCCANPAAGITAIVFAGGAGEDDVRNTSGGSDLCGFSSTVMGGSALLYTAFLAGGTDRWFGSGSTTCTNLSEVAYGGAEGDVLESNGHASYLYGEDSGHFGNEIYDAGDGSLSNTLATTLVGGNGLDLVETVNSLGNVIIGGDGENYLWGGDGADEIHGGSSYDYISGGDGNDTIWGQGGTDIVAGDEGVDTLYGGAGNDTICGGDGNGDVMYGGDGDDILDDDATLGVSYGQAGTNTCDAITTAYGCSTTPTLSYQCGSY